MPAADAGPARDWTEAGVYRAGDGVHRIPLPLPNDALKAVNVYVLEDDAGLVLIDGGWDLGASMDLLATGLAELGRRVEDIRKVLVTHAHRDHYTQAVAIRRRSGARVFLGAPERAAVELYHGRDGRHMAGRLARLRQGGAGELADALIAGGALKPADPAKWEWPDTWLADAAEIPAGARVLTGLHTPGHTQGHFVYSDPAAALLFAGDHVLPRITPSIGFEPAVSENALGQYLQSLLRVQRLPDARLLPAHGPVTGSVHERVAQLLAHHDRRLSLALEIAGPGARTALDVARGLPWTRRETAFARLDSYNQMLAVNETAAHLDVLVSRGDLTAGEQAGIRYYRWAGRA